MINTLYFGRSMSIKMVTDRPTMHWTRVCKNNLKVIFSEGNDLKVIFSEGNDPKVIFSEGNNLKVTFSEGNDLKVIF